MIRLSLLLFAAFCVVQISSSDLQAAGTGSGYGGGCAGGTCGGGYGGQLGGGYYGGQQMAPGYATPAPAPYAGNYGTPYTTGYGGNQFGGGGYPGGGYGNAIIVRVRVGGQVVDAVPNVMTYYPGINNPGYNPGYYPGNLNYNYNQRQGTGARYINNRDVLLGQGQLRPTTPLTQRGIPNTAPARQMVGGYRYRF